MKLLTTIKLSKALIGLMVGCFCLIVSIDNVIDFNSNYMFVKHVLAMDTMQPFSMGSICYGDQLLRHGYS